jgi:hypothetical protein
MKLIRAAFPFQTEKLRHLSVEGFYWTILAYFKNGGTFVSPPRAYNALSHNGPCLLLYSSDTKCLIHVTVMTQHT